MPIIKKKSGPKLREEVPEGYRTTLIIDRSLYLKFGGTARMGGITIFEAINEAMELWLTKWKKGGAKRQKALISQAEAERQSWLKSSEMIGGKRYVRVKCAKCMEVKLIPYGDSLCEECRNEENLENVSKIESAEKRDEHLKEVRSRAWELFFLGKLDKKGVEVMIKDAENLK